jgi:hypothetical protein
MTAACRRASGLRRRNAMEWMVEEASAKVVGQASCPSKESRFCQRNRTGWKPIPLILGLLQRSLEELKREKINKFFIQNL